LYKTPNQLSASSLDIFWARQRASRRSVSLSSHKREYSFIFLSISPPCSVMVQCQLFGRPVCLDFGANWIDLVPVQLLLRSIDTQTGRKRIESQQKMA